MAGISKTLLQVDEDDLKLIVKECVKQAVYEIEAARKVEQPLPDRIDINSVMQMTGQGESWIYKKTMKGCPDPLPFEKFGKRLVFSRKAIQEYIDDHTKPITTSDTVMAAQLSKVANKHLKNLYR